MKLKEDSKNFFSFWCEDDTEKSGWGTYKLYVHYTQLPGRVFPVEVQFISKDISVLEQEAKTHLDYENSRQNFGALGVYQRHSFDYVELFNEIKDFDKSLWEKYLS